MLAWYPLGMGRTAIYALLLLIGLSACNDQNAPPQGPGQIEAGTIAQNFPEPGMAIAPGVTALVVTNPQVEFLSPEGLGWGLVGRGVVENGVVENLASLFATANEVGMPVFVSPYEFRGAQTRWQFRAVHSRAEANDPNDADLTPPSTHGGTYGGDWHDELRKFIEAPATTIATPHKLYGPESNDLIEQLHNAGIERVILAGMCANLSLEAHLRELVEQGFEVQVVTDATAGIVANDYDGYSAALTNFRLIASKTDTTENTVDAMKAGYE